MKHHFMRLLLMLAVVAALGEAPARAEFADFSYSWSVQPEAVLPSGTGSVQVALTLGSSSGQATIGGASVDIPFATLTTSSSAAASQPDTFANPFTLKLSLKDATSPTAGVLTFSGNIAGTLTNAKSFLTGTLDDAVDGKVTKSVALGSHNYEITLNKSFGLPDPVSDVNTQLDAVFRVTSVGGGSVKGTENPGGSNNGPLTSSTPEPSSLLLGGMALVGLTARRWSRLRRRAA